MIGVGLDVEQVLLLVKERNDVWLATLKLVAEVVQQLGATAHVDKCLAVIAPFDGPVHDSAAEEYQQHVAARVAAGSTATVLELVLWQRYVAMMAHNHLAELRTERDALLIIAERAKETKARLEMLRDGEEDALRLLQSLPKLKLEFMGARHKFHSAQQAASSEWGLDADKAELAYWQEKFAGARATFEAALHCVHKLMELGGFPELAVGGLSPYIAEVNLLQLSDFAPCV